MLRTSGSGAGTPALPSNVAGWGLRERRRAHRAVTSHWKPDGCHALAPGPVTVRVPAAAPRAIRSAHRPSPPHGRYRPMTPSTTPRGSGSASRSTDETDLAATAKGIAGDVADRA